MPSRIRFAAVTAIFFLSGSAGLVYQVLWMRSLGLFFGSDMYGVSIILSSFMGGLALGSLLGGRLAEHTRRPLFWYGVAELGIGLVAIPFVSILGAFDPLLKSVYANTGEEGRAAYELLRVVLATTTLLLPTTLMGATLPLILKHFVRRRSVLGVLGAHFYAVNTLGALAGTLAAGFLLLPRLGMTRSTWCTAAINLSIGSICLALGWRPSEAVEDARALPVADLDPVSGFGVSRRRLVANAALIAFGVSGFGSLALEVVWTRILLISFSATVYSFATTLACFLVGIVVGARAVSRVVDRHENPLALFAALELGVGVSVGVLGLLLHALPGLFGRLLIVLASAWPGGREQALVASTLLISFPLLVVPASLLGATFPVALRIYTTSVARVGSRSGNIYGANTLGAVLGSLSAGLVLIPSLGARASLALVALLFVAVGASLAALPAPSRMRPLGWRSTFGAASVTLACAAIVLLLPYRPTLNFAQETLEGAELLYHAEGVQNTIDVVRATSGATALIINGNVEADDGPRQRRHFVLKGHLPLLLIDEPKTVLVIGLGMGITLQATARHPGLERIDVIELSPDILDAQSRLREVNGNVAEHPLVHVRIEDGRLYLKLSEERFDMITVDPIHPKISRVGYLYSQEYYESIRERLKEGGVVCQWMPMYQISPTRLRSAVKTFQKVFPHATFWYVEGHALLVAGHGPLAIDYPRLVERFENEAVREDLASIGIDSPEALLAHLMMGPAEIRSFVASESFVPDNTDDYPYLEYFVPRDLFHATEDNVREWVGHLSDPADFVRNLPPDARVRLERSSRDRARRILAREEPERRPPGA
jgi:spermidine synthase